MECQNCLAWSSRVAVVKVMGWYLRICRFCRDRRYFDQTPDRQDVALVRICDNILAAARIRLAAIELDSKLQLVKRAVAEFGSSIDEEAGGLGSPPYGIHSMDEWED